MGLTKLVIRGARQHNLKNISVEIPRNSLTVITGLSGSGKSSLAFDTIYAEGQRRYVESLSAYARQFLDQMERPEVDVIEGLSPSIAIEQKTTTRAPRSTRARQTQDPPPRSRHRPSARQAGHRLAPRAVHRHRAQARRRPRHRVHRWRQGPRLLRKTRLPRLRHFRPATRAALLQLQFSLRRMPRLQRSRLQI